MHVILQFYIEQGVLAGILRCFLETSYGYVDRYLFGNIISN